MNILSLFDGMSCGQIALNKCDIKYTSYFASEIDPYVIKVTQANYPETKQLGDITKLDTSTLPKIDLLFGGSPCQSFSSAGDKTGFEGKSGLFWEYVRVLEEVKPKYFLLENVKMKKEWENIISDTLGVKPIELNSKDFGAQHRVRLFWTNIPITNPTPKSNKTLKDIITETYSERTVADTERNLRHEKKLTDKSLACTATMYKGAGNNGMTLIRRPGQKELSVLNVTEVENLMNVPLGYTNHVSNTQRYKMLGNGWDVAVIEWIFNHLKYEK
jgi:DNA-cytosine methyltransferase